MVVIYLPKKYVKSVSSPLLSAYEQRTILLINHVGQGGHDHTQSRIHKDSEMTFLSISRERAEHIKWLRRNTRTSNVFPYFVEWNTSRDMVIN